jgi:hypothetical protein
MPEIGWIVLNGLVGVPLALAVLVIGRECLRALVGLGFGFRIFELGWGIGRPLFAHPLGPIDFRLGSLPLAGTAIAASGSPRRHRAARVAMAGAPLSLQIVGLLFLHYAHASTAFDGIAAGPAPWAMLAAANVGLVALHLLVPFETRAGVRSDIRMLLDLAFGHADSARAARASYYARLARHQLERADVAGAHKAIGQGLIQLGRESLLVAVEARLARAELSSVIDQGACADALRDLIERAEREASRPPAATISDRLRRASITALPPGLALLVLIALVADPLVQFAHDRWLERSDAILVAAETSACADRIEQGSLLTDALARLLPDDPERRRGRHQRLALLEQCRGGIEEAAAHMAIALAAADSVRAEHAEQARPDPRPWLASELEFAALLCDGADLESERGAFRIALASLTRAESTLELARNRVTTWTDPATRTQATDQLQAVAEAITSTRSRVLSRMATL